MRFTPYLVLTIGLLISGQSPGLAYPEFQAFSEKNSGRNVDCAMCHVNPNGPIGQDVGQEGGLTPADLALLNKERMAMEPGVDVHSPILNKFGNLIIKQLGRKKFIELRQHPADLPAALGSKSDLDGDGIADGQEFLDGTDPLNKSHGDPGKLFLINLKRYQVPLLLAVGSILLLNYGFLQILSGFEAIRRIKRLKRADEQAGIEAALGVKTCSEARAHLEAAPE